MLGGKRIVNILPSVRKPSRATELVMTTRSGVALVADKVLATKVVTAKGVRRKAGTCEAMWAAAAVKESATAGTPTAAAVKELAAATPTPTTTAKGRCNPCPQRAQGKACEAHDYLFSHDVLI